MDGADYRDTVALNEGDVGDAIDWLRALAEGLARAARAYHDLAFALSSSQDIEATVDQWEKGAQGRLDLVQAHLDEYFAGGRSDHALLCALIAERLRLKASVRAVAAMRKRLANKRPGGTDAG